METEAVIVWIIIANLACGFACLSFGGTIGNFALGFIFGLFGLVAASARASGAKVAAEVAKLNKSLVVVAEMLEEVYTGNGMLGDSQSQRPR